MNVAIITARGGSKRIPRKNIREFCGKPIISYSITAAKESNCFEEVMVSTDDEEIADIARQYGATVPFFRSQANSDDFSTTADVLSEVLEMYEQLGKRFDRLCCIYPTAPFVTSAKLCEARSLFDAKMANCVLTVVQFGFPPQRALIKDEGGLRYWIPENEKKRSQDLFPVYHDAGQFYFLDARKFQETKTLVPCGSYPLLCTETEVQDIDTEMDWMLAEMKYKILHRI